MAGALGEKAKRFPAEYLIDLNATKAAIRCGYSERTAYSQGQRLLKKVEIQQMIQELQQQRQQRTQITADRVLQEVARIAFARITDVTSFDANGVVLKNSTELPHDVTAAIESVSSTATDGEYGTRTSLKVKMHSKVAALEKLTRLLGMELSGAIQSVLRAGYVIVDPHTGEEVKPGGTTESETDSEDSEQTQQSDGQFTEPQPLMPA